MNFQNIHNKENIAFSFAQAERARRKKSAWQHSIFNRCREYYPRTIRIRGPQPTGRPRDYSQMTRTPDNRRWLLLAGSRNGRQQNRYCTCGRTGIRRYLCSVLVYIPPLRPHWHLSGTVPQIQVYPGGMKEYEPTFICQGTAAVNLKPSHSVSK